MEKFTDLLRTQAEKERRCGIKNRSVILQNCGRNGRFFPSIGNNVATGRLQVYTHPFGIASRYW